MKRAYSIESEQGGLSETLLQLVKEFAREAKLAQIRGQIPVVTLLLKENLLESSPNGRHVTWLSGAKAY
ncbi:hypothetical protein PC129_g18592 [Phytophthora cactorum]|uniref:Uncharacterized protein n=1 Tax=Phytophthora cactorum TaxID=29920 RepID=A0A8T1HEB2_9STRA|nr:hypothetical protein PC129_g18592 [Phytophthora cactorum]